MRAGSRAAPPTILVLGAGGQLGRELVARLPASGTTIACDHAALDVTDVAAIGALVRRTAPQFIVNAAAYTAVDRAESERDLAFAVNAHAAGALARAAKRIGAVLIHYSTDYVFDGTQTMPYVEDVEPRPLNVYGASKRAGEQAIEASGAMAIVLRTSWVYARQGTNFLTTMERLAGDRDELRVVADQTGVPNWTRALARATAQLIERGRDDLASHAGLYHLSAQGACTWYDFACAILHGRRTRVLPITTSEYPTPARRPAYGVLDASRFARTFGFALPPWATTLRECLDAPVEPPRALPVN